MSPRVVILKNESQGVVGPNVLSIHKLWTSQTHINSPLETTLAFPIHPMRVVELVQDQTVLSQGQSHKEMVLCSTDACAYSRVNGPLCYHMLRQDQLSNSNTLYCQEDTVNLGGVTDHIQCPRNCLTGKDFGNKLYLLK